MYLVVGTKIKQLLLCYCLTIRGVYYMWSKQKVDKLFSNFVQEQEVKDRYKKILRLSPGVRKVTIKAIRDERHNKN